VNPESPLTDNFKSFEYNINNYFVVFGWGIFSDRPNSAVLDISVSSVGFLNLALMPTSHEVSFSVEFIPFLSPAG